MMYQVKLSEDEFEVLSSCIETELDTAECTTNQGVEGIGEYLDTLYDITEMFDELRQDGPAACSQRIVDELMDKVVEATSNHWLARLENWAEGEGNFPISCPMFLYRLIDWAYWAFVFSPTAINILLDQC